MAVDIDLLPDLADLAVAVDQKGGALDAHGRLAVHVLLPPGAVALGHLVADVGEEGKVEAVLVAELAVARHVVGRDAQHHGAPGLQVRGTVPEGASLPGAAGSVVLRIKVEHHGLAAETGELDLSAVVGGQGEIRGRLALFDPVGHSGFSSGSEKSRGGDIAPAGEESLSQ